MSALFITSSLLSRVGVVHGFSLRAGGVSAGPFASLNLSRAVGDEPEAVEENLRRLAQSAGLPGAQAFATAKQVHRDRLLLARSGASGHEFDELFAASEPCSAQVSGENSTRATDEPEADAILSRQPGLAAAVRVADCTPILLAASDVRASCAVHSGWRGARLSIAGRGVQALASLGADPARIVAAIGPCIGRCCYVVSAELANSFRAQFGDEVADDPARVSEPHLDLRACASIALARAGLGSAQIEQVGGCTACERENFFSHRRDQGRTGRNLAFIAP
jgi:hypothetical protein